MAGGRVIEQAAQLAQIGLAFQQLHGPCSPSVAPKTRRRPRHVNRLIGPLRRKVRNDVPLRSHSTDRLNAAHRMRADPARSSLSDSEHRVVRPGAGGSGQWRLQWKRGAF
jgi:hypothetical protein